MKTITPAQLLADLRTHFSASDKDNHLGRPVSSRLFAASLALMGDPLACVHESVFVNPRDYEGIPADCSRPPRTAVAGALLLAGLATLASVDGHDAKYTLPQHLLDCIEEFKALMAQETI